ncbi:MAG: helix-turn-helix domain-containing protein, partial [Psychrobacillus psychrodurans]
MTKLQRNKVELPISSVYSAIKTNSLKQVFIESAKLIRADIIETTQTNLIETLTELIKDIPSEKVLSSIKRGNAELDEWLQANTTPWNPALGSPNIQNAEQATIGLSYCDQALAESGTVLTDTLDSYLDCGGAVETCARLLFVHPNTVRYRLKRIAEVTGR